MKIGFIGAGTVGTALGRKLSEKGYRVSVVMSRSASSAQQFASKVRDTRIVSDAQTVADLADTVFVTTPDGVIPSVVSSVNWQRGQNVLHCSGADSLDILDPARQAGASVGVFHPLQTFANIEQAISNLAGSTFGLEADEPLLGSLKTMATDLEGNFVVLKASDKVLYHAAAVIACNYAVTLMKLATDLWGGFGVSAEEATKALVPLLRGTVSNIASVGLPNCLTGPVARGDTGTLRKHMAALEAGAPEVLAAYRQLGLQTVPIAEAKGRISREQAEEMRLLFGV